MKNPADYVGTPYAELDCFALVRLCARECFGLELPTLPEHTDYAARIVSDEISSGNWLKINYDERQAGDVMTLSPTSGSASHVGIVIDSMYVLHNDKKYGAIIQNTAGLRHRGFLFRNVYRFIK